MYFCVRLGRSVAYFVILILFVVTLSGCGASDAEDERFVELWLPHYSGIPSDSLSEDSSSLEGINMKDNVHVVGYVSQFPFSGALPQLMPNSGINALVVRVPWGLVEKEQGQFDLSSLEKQIAYAETHGIKLALAIEANMAHAGNVKWLRELASSAGETQKSIEGHVYHDPSMSSKIYVDNLRTYIHEVISYVQQRDRSNVVFAYVTGAEWWYLSPYRYNARDLAVFREWLKSKYGTIDALNQIWSSDFKSWTQVSPPTFSLQNMPDYWKLSAIDWIYSPDRSEYGWGLTTVNELHVVAGGKYRVSVDVRGEGPDPKVFIRMMWNVKNRDLDMVVYDSPWTRVSKEWNRLVVEAWAPENSNGLDALRIMGKVDGEVDIKDMILEVFDPGKDIYIPVERTTTEHWMFNWWWGNQADLMLLTSTDTSQDGELVYSLSVSVRPQVLKQYEAEKSYASAAHYDFTIFNYEYVARFNDEFARIIRENDDTRMISSYMTMAWATPFEWDFIYNHGIALDWMAKTTPNLDVLGMQLTSANGDVSSVMAALDIARKYGKPMWATDLLDFTNGCHIGYDGYVRLSQSAIQHGLTGIFYYTWDDPVVRDYSLLQNFSTDKIRELNAKAFDSLELVKDKAIKPNILLVEPTMPYWSGAANEDNNNIRDFIGWYKILTHTGLYMDVYTYNELEDATVDELRQYEAVVIPDSPFVVLDAVKVLDEYVRAGGNVIVSGRYARYDQYARPIREAFFGGLNTIETCSFSGDKVHIKGLEDLKLDASIYMSNILTIQDDLLRDMDVSKVDAIGNIEIDGAASLVLEYGKGKILWIGGALGDYYLGEAIRSRYAGNTPPLWMQTSNATEIMDKAASSLDLVDAFMEYAGVFRSVRLSHQSRDLGVVMWEAENEDAVFVINHGDKDIDELSLTISGIDPEIQYEVTVSTDSSGLEKLEHIIEGDKIMVDMPRFGITSVVVVTK